MVQKSSFKVGHVYSLRIRVLTSFFFLLCLKFCVDFKFLVYFNLSMIEKELFSKNNVTFFVQYSSK